jgi:hypothetical protein
MTERLVWEDPERAERVLLDDHPAHGLIDLIVEEDGLAVSARLDRDGASCVRAALARWLAL